MEIELIHLLQEITRSRQFQHSRHGQWSRRKQEFRHRDALATTSSLEFLSKPELVNMIYPLVAQYAQRRIIPDFHRSQ